MILNKQRYGAKQVDVMLNADARWNILCGAVSSGKTFATYDLLVTRILTQPEGAFLIIGKTERTLKRNILDPMRERFGSKYISQIYGSGEIDIFGRQCYIAGANDAKAVSKIQGITLVYAYGDEVTTWNEDVFQMLKSRLRKPGARFDGTCNPDHPNHWFKLFLDDEDISLKYWHFTIDDNKFLPKDYVKQIKKEYKGVWYERFILGRWIIAEGAIYPQFAENSDSFLIDDADIPKDFNKILIGIDWGDEGSSHSFTAIGITQGYKKVIVLSTEKHSARGLMPKDVEDKVVAFAYKIINKFGFVNCIFCDHINTFINGCRVALNTAGINTSITKAYKCEITERILTTTKLMALDRLRLTRDCDSLVNAFKNAVWDSKHQEKRLDDGTSDIDSLDSFEYSWSTYIDLINNYKF